MNQNNLIYTVSGVRLQALLHLISANCSNQVREEDEINIFCEKFFSCPPFLWKQYRYLVFIPHVEGRQEAIKGDAARAKKHTAAGSGSITQIYKTTREQI